jgi:hypothetical protein
MMLNKPAEDDWRVLEPVKRIMAAVNGKVKPVDDETAQCEDWGNNALFIERALRDYLKKVRSQGATIDKEVLQAAKSVIKQDCLNEEGWLEGADGKEHPQMTQPRLKEGQTSQKDLKSTGDS